MFQFPGLLLISAVPKVFLQRITTVTYFKKVFPWSAELRKCACYMIFPLLTKQNNTFKL